MFLHRVECQAGESLVYRGGGAFGSDLVGLDGSGGFYRGQTKEPLLGGRGNFHGD